MWKCMYTFISFQTPLSNGSVDLAVFCLALMGTNCNEFIAEANRVLKKKWEFWPDWALGNFRKCYYAWWIKTNLIFLLNVFVKCAYLVFVDDTNAIDLWSANKNELKLTKILILKSYLIILFSNTIALVKRIHHACACIDWLFCGCGQLLVYHLQAEGLDRIFLILREHGQAS